MSENRRWAAYVRAVAGEVPDQAIVDRILDKVGPPGVSQPTINRWVKGRHSGELKAGNVAAFATAYGVPVLQAFFAAGLLKKADVATGLSREDIGFVMKLDSVELKSQSQRATRGPRRLRPRPPLA